ncbi:MAG: 3'(2'),5'-bisphosphate nucleotidase CysQ [Falsihalocynthiibacter arcticus]
MVADIDLLIDAAYASGEIAKKYWKKTPDVWEKSGGAGPVTEADLAIDRMLKSELTHARPDYGWLSEETEDTSDRLNREHVFIIDPIDGTRAFIEGSPAFSHSLAIAKNGVVTAAAVYLPALDRLYCATKHGNATLNRDRIDASTRSKIDGATTLAAKTNFSAHLWQGPVPQFDHHFRSSLAYRLCLIAHGRFDVMLTLRDTWEWDVAAGSLIAERAGACVTDQIGQRALFNNPRPMLHGMVAAPPEIHAGIISRLAPR